MISPASEIQYPPSETTCTKAKMIARMEALSGSSNALLAVISKRLGAEAHEYHEEVEALTVEQEQLIANMKKLIRE